MLSSGELRHRLARILNAAYGDGLLSEATLAHRLDLVFGSKRVNRSRVVRCRLRPGDRLTIGDEQLLVD